METERLHRATTQTRGRPKAGQGTLIGAAFVGIVALAAGVLLTRPTPSPTTAGAATVPQTGQRSGDQPGLTADDQTSPLTLDQLKTIVTRQAAKPRYDDTVLGWRIGPYEVLSAAGIDDRNLVRACDPYQAGADTITSLDFTVGYMPPDFKIGPIAGPVKWLCDQEALSVTLMYNVGTPLGSGQITFSRYILARRSIEMDTRFDSVETGDISGHPAIIVHPDDDKTGLGLGEVVVIEDDTDPEFTILTISADNGVPFDELLKIAEAVK